MQIGEKDQIIKNLEIEKLDLFSKIESLESNYFENIQ